MGVPFREPQSSRPSRIADVTSISWLAGTKPQPVSITLDAGCLSRLLREHHLHVEDFLCTDAESKARVRSMLLGMLMVDSEIIRPQIG